MGVPNCKAMTNIWNIFFLFVQSTVISSNFNFVVVVCFCYYYLFLVSHAIGNFFLHQMKYFAIILIKYQNMCKICRRDCHVVIVVSCCVTGAILNTTSDIFWYLYCLPRSPFNLYSQLSIGDHSCKTNLCIMVGPLWGPTIIFFWTP